MTTQVTILVSGNKAVLAKVVGEGSSDPGNIIMPKSFETKMIYGEQVLEIKEVGEFM